MCLLYAEDKILLLLLLGDVHTTEFSVRNIRRVCVADIHADLAVDLDAD